jgi:hypothetical protein
VPHHTKYKLKARVHTLPLYPQNSATGARTQAARVGADCLNQLDVADLLKRFSVDLWLDWLTAMVSFANAIMSQMGNSLGRSLLATAMGRKSANGPDSAGHEGERIKLHPVRPSAC